MGILQYLYTFFFSIKKWYVFRILRNSNIKVHWVTVFMNKYAISFQRIFFFTKEIKLSSFFFFLILNKCFLFFKQKLIILIQLGYACMLTNNYNGHFNFSNLTFLTFHLSQQKRNNQVTALICFVFFNNLRWKQHSQLFFLIE